MQPIQPTIEPESSTSRERSRNVLARYGSIPQVAVFTMPNECRDKVFRNTDLVVETDRGEEVATALEILQSHVVDPAKPVTGRVVRLADNQDLAVRHKQLRAARESFAEWRKRLQDWKLQAELVDVEITFDQQTVLYVLNDQNAETTRLALLAAAGGHGVIHVQPLSADGVVSQPPAGSGGCGSGGCGSKGHC